MNKKKSFSPPERRKASQLPDTMLYKAKSIDAFVRKERRKDELMRLREVQQQKVLWRCLLMICFFFNCLFVALAIWGERLL